MLCGPRGPKFSSGCSLPDNPKCECAAHTGLERNFGTGSLVTSLHSDLQNQFSFPYNLFSSLWKSGKLVWCLVCGPRGPKFSSGSFLPDNPKYECATHSARLVWGGILELAHWSLLCDLQNTNSLSLFLLSRKVLKLIWSLPCQGVPSLLCPACPSSPGVCQGEILPKSICLFAFKSKLLILKQPVWRLKSRLHTQPRGVSLGGVN